MNQPDVRSGVARRAAIAAAVGSLVEWYDFSLYAASAALIFNVQFFAPGNPQAGVMASLATFAVGYFARPFGGAILGHLGDKIGRKPVMVITLALMGAATMAIGFLPTYAQVGLLAPLLLVLIRILQGLGAGAEYAGAIILATESAPPARKGIYASWSPVGVWAGSALGLGSIQIALYFTGPNFVTWGWRLPFFASVVLLGVSLYIRRRITETDDFQEAKRAHRIEGVPLAKIFRNDKRRVLVAMASHVLISGYIYVPQVWMLSYLTNNMHVAAPLALGLNIAMFLISSAFLPFFAHLGDRLGRRRVYMAGATVGVLWPIPMFMLVDTREPFLIGVALVVSFGLGAGLSFAVQAAFLPEMFAPEVRYSSVALAREVPAAVLGGTAPLLASALYVGFGSWMPVALLMMFYAAVALFGAYLSKHFRRDADQADPNGQTYVPAFEVGSLFGRSAAGRRPEPATSDAE